MKLVPHVRWLSLLRLMERTSTGKTRREAFHQHRPIRAGVLERGEPGSDAAVEVRHDLASEELERSQRGVTVRPIVGQHEERPEPTRMCT